MKLIFWLRAIKKSTLKTVCCRITINKKRKDFSTGIVICPHLWLGAELLINPIEPLNAEHNQELMQIKADLKRAFNYLVKERLPISATSVLALYQKRKNEFLIEPEPLQKIPSVLEILNKGMESKFNQIGLKITESSYNCYLRYQNNFLKYLKQERIKASEMPITSLTLSFCNKFIKELVTNWGLAETYANKHKEVLRIIIYTAHYEADGWHLKLMSKDLDSHREPEPTVVYLTGQEIERIEKHSFIGKLDRTRDMLLALCEIGQHIGDYIKIVKYGTLEKDDEGDYWLTMQRQKSHVTYNILVSPRLHRLIKKYNGLDKLPYLSDQKANDYLKLIALYCDIDKNLTTKIGRKTFADRYLNEFATDESMVAKLMGLKGTKSLKHYVRHRRKLLKSAFLKAM